MTDTETANYESRDSKNHTPRWGEDQVLALLELPFNDLIFRAHTIHRQHFDANEVQLSTLLSIKTGACPEDCAYCPQSAHHKTGIEADPLLAVDDIVTAAKNAKHNGATRFCMGAAWRNPKDDDLDTVIEAIKRVKMLGLETCATLGMLTADQAQRLKQAGLDYYNHNLDTSAAFYSEIISTRTYDDRLQTLNFVRECDIRVCCGGIIGMGESRNDRAALITTLANLPVYPESVPINMLVQVPGTPLFGADKPDAFEFVRTVAVSRITMPKAYVRLSAGREEMSDELQAWCFFAGANSIFSGEKLLTTGNVTLERDQSLFERLGIRPQTASPRRS